MPAKNTIRDLYDHLFETIEALRDDEDPMDVARANAVAHVAGKILEGAKLEVKLLNITGETRAGGILPDPVIEERPRKQLGDAQVLRRRA